MKKNNISILVLIFVSICIASCSKDKEEDFAYPMSQLYGQWDATQLYVSYQWYDVTKYPYTRFGMSITFYENGKFYGTGYLGTGSGTYKASGNKITTYVDGKEYAVYTVNSLTGTEEDLTLTMGNESLQMKAKKKK